MEEQQKNSTPNPGTAGQSLATEASPSPKPGRLALFFKAWVLPLIIISIPLAAFFILKNVIFVDKSDYEKVDNLYKTVVKAADKETEDKNTPIEKVPAATETPASEAPTAKEAAAKIPSSEAPNSEDPAVEESAAKEPATETPVIEEAINPDASEGKISR